MSRPSGWLLVVIGPYWDWLVCLDGTARWWKGVGRYGWGQLLAADSYAFADADTIIVTATTGEGAWTRITNVVETVDSVQVSIRVLHWLVAVYADVGTPITWTLDLARPLGDRVVYDGLQDVPRRDNPAQD